jgi:hypothetical protein
VIDFRLPDWLIFLSILLNLVLTFVCIAYQDISGVILCVFCLSCFIITYRINKGERDEKEKKGQSD